MSTNTKPDYELELAEIGDADPKLTKEALKYVDGDEKGLDEAIDEAQLLAEQMVEAATVADKLVEVQAIATEELEADRITPAAAKMFSIALTELYGRVGIVPDTLVPAVESYGDDAEKRVQAVRISLESIDVSMQRINKSLNIGLESLTDKVSGLLKSLTQTTNSTIKRLNKLKARIEAGELKFEATGEIELGQYDAAALARAGQISQNLDKDLRDLYAVYQTGTQFSTKFVDNYSESMNDLVSQYKKGIIEDVILPYTPPQGFEKVSDSEATRKRFGLTGRMANQKFFDFYSSGPELGSFEVQVVLPKPEFAKSKGASKVNTNLINNFGLRYRNHAGDVKAGTIKAIGSNEATNLLNLVQTMARELDQNRTYKIFRMFGAERDRFDKALLAMHQADAKKILGLFSGKDNRAQYRYVASVATMVYYSLNQQTAINYRIVRVLNAILSYIEKSATKA